MVLLLEEAIISTETNDLDIGKDLTTKDFSIPPRFKAFKEMKQNISILSDTKVLGWKLPKEININKEREFSNNKFKSYKAIKTKGVTTNERQQEISSSSTFLSKYEIVSKLFESKSTMVYLGKNNKTHQKVAIKIFRIINNKTNQEENVPEEVLCQKKAEKISVQNGRGSVLKIIDWYVYNEYLTIVTEYDENFKSLKDCVINQRNEHFSEIECKTIFKLLLELIQKLNKKGIFHLDLKPDNVLYNFETKELKLIDFGHATSVGPGENPKINFKCGTKCYRTPQQVSNEDCRGKDADVWGVGQVLFYCLHGYRAFESELDVVYGGVNIEVEVTDDCRDLLTRMISKNTEDRLTAQEIVEHPWLNGNCNSKMFPRCIKLDFNLRFKLGFLLMLILCFFTFSTRVLIILCFSILITLIRI